MAARAAAAYFSRTVSRTAVAVRLDACRSPAAQPQPSPCCSPQQEAFSEDAQQPA
jgi:hypothetical protein